MSLPESDRLNANLLLRLEREAIAQMLKARAALHETNDGHKRPCDDAVATVLREMAAKIVAMTKQDEAEPPPAPLSSTLTDGPKMVRCKCGGSVSSDGGYVHAADCAWMKRREADEFFEETLGVMTAGSGAAVEPRTGFGAVSPKDSLPAGEAGVSGAAGAPEQRSRAEDGAVGVMTSSGDWFPSRSVARRSASLKGEPPPTFVPTTMKKKEEGP